MDISLPSRYLIYMPRRPPGRLQEHQGPRGRERLPRIVAGRHDRQHHRRTEGRGAPTRGELRAELKYLPSWEGVQRKASSQTGTLIHRELGLTFPGRATSPRRADLPDRRPAGEYKRSKISSPGWRPGWPTACQHYTGKTPIFQAFSVDRELAHIPPAAHRPAVGRLHHHPEAESLCAIDVNTGKVHRPTNRRRRPSPATNLGGGGSGQQLRLRNIGGIIVIDFVDMRRKLA